MYVVARSLLVYTPGAGISLLRVEKQMQDSEAKSSVPGLSSGVPGGANAGDSKNCQAVGVEQVQPVL